MGLRRVTFKFLINHPMERYRKIRASYLEVCRQALVEPIEVNCPIYVYFQQVEGAIKFAQDINTTFTPAQIVHTSYDAVNKTSLYSQALKEWKNKAATNQTWTIFK